MFSTGDDKNFFIDDSYFENLTLTETKSITYRLDIKNHALIAIVIVQFDTVLD